jgi:SAM-dependent methyltransferase
VNNLLNIVTKLHTATERGYLERMMDDKVACMKKSREFGFDFWDGDRKFGYGGYNYDGRWRIVAEDLIKEYNLKDGCKILDVGCAKGFLLYEFKKILPNSIVVGFDISEYAITNSMKEIKDFLFCHKAQDKFPFTDDEFDLVVSINTIHNLPIHKLKNPITEIERVGVNKFILVEGYRNEVELFNLVCWSLSGDSHLRPEEWLWMYKEWGYSGDYEFIYFE